MFKKLKSVRESTINVPFVLIVLVAGGIAYTNPERITIDLFCILLISIFLDTLHFFWMSNKVEIVIEPNESKIQKEEELEVLIKVENRSFWPTTYLYIYPEEGYRLVLKEKRAYCIFLGGQSIKKFKVTYEAVLSGKQKVGLTRAFAKDYLGLYKKEILVPDKQEVKVLPEIKESLGLEGVWGEGVGGTIGTQSQMFARQGAQGEITEELAPYKEGDSPKLLHWKILARKDQLLVRQRESGENGGQNILLILSPVGSKIVEEEAQHKLQDRSLTVSLSLSHQFIKRGYRVIFMYYHKGNWIKAELKEDKALQYLREKLARYESLHSISDKAYKRVLYSFGKAINRQGVGQLVVTEDIDESLAYYLDRHTGNLEETKLIYIGKKINHTKSLNIETWRVNNEYTLEKE